MKRYFALTFFYICFLESAHALELLTYNLGLANGFVDHYEERRLPLFQQIKNSNADIICLQELWSEEDRQTLAKEMAPVYPHQLITPIERVTSEHSPACKFSNLFGEGSIVTCMRSRCDGKKGREFTACIIADCKLPLESLKTSHPSCANALMAQVGTHPLLAMLKLLLPFGKIDTYIYGGSNGLAIFSKYPIKPGASGMVSLRDYSTLSRRDLLYGVFEVEKKEVFVGCTHLTANLTDSAPYAGKFSGWEQENLKQSEYLLTKIEQLAAGRPQAIMGDFNFSPAVPSQGIEANFEKSLLAFKAQGYFDPLSDGAKPACTFCKSNSLNLPTDPDQLIDHIFLKKVAPKNIIGAQIVMDQKIETKNSVKTNLSDHYGIKVKLTSF
ncbi:MAG: endonuclease/exonuclease/phosphatase family protein [Bdellovibrio sp.]|nr:endonuclease/exonuclease/phosphatase family protein [Bdellovibrio sp.]